VFNTYFNFLYKITKYIYLSYIIEIIIVKN